MKIRPKRERRSPTRLPDPRCHECRSRKTRVTLRTDYALYYRCERCEHLWVVQKPGKAWGESIVD